MAVEACTGAADSGSGGMRPSGQTQEPVALLTYDGEYGRVWNLHNDEEITAARVYRCRMSRTRSDMPCGHKTPNSFDHCGAFADALGILCPPAIGGHRAGGGFKIAAGSICINRSQQGNARASPSRAKAAAFLCDLTSSVRAFCTKIRTKSSTVLSGGGQIPSNRLPRSSARTVMFCTADM